MTMDDGQYSGSPRVRVSSQEFTALASDNADHVRVGRTADEGPQAGFTWSNEHLLYVADLPLSEVDEYYTATWEFRWHDATFVLEKIEQGVLLGRLKRADDKWATEHGPTVVDRGWVVGRFRPDEVEGPHEVRTEHRTLRSRAMEAESITPPSDEAFAAKTRDARFQATYRPADPARSGFATNEEKQNFLADGRFLAQRLRDSVDRSAVSVEYAGDGSIEVEPGPPDNVEAFLANAKESAKRRREMPPEEQRPFPRPDRCSGEPLGTDGDGHIRTRRSE